MCVGMEERGCVYVFLANEKTSLFHPPPRATNPNPSFSVSGWRHLEPNRSQMVLCRILLFHVHVHRDDVFIYAHGPCLRMDPIVVD